MNLFFRISGVRRNDIIDFLMDEIKKIGDDESESGLKTGDIDTDLALISNAIVFFFGGFSTMTQAMSTLIFCLVDKPSTQERAREEIMKVIGDSQTITADHLKDLKYLENVINESLRHHGLNPIMFRTCTQDYKIPDSHFIIRKGMQVNILAKAFEDQCFFNPSEFDPENFDAQNNPNKFGFSEFGQGPRNCIAQRYAYIALKLALVKTITRFEVVRCENTVDKLEYDLSKNKFKGGVMFRVKHIAN